MEPVNITMPDVKLVFAAVDLHEVLDSMRVTLKVMHDASDKLDQIRFLDLRGMHNFLAELVDKAIGLNNELQKQLLTPQGTH